MKHTEHCGATINIGWFVDNAIFQVVEYLCWLKWDIAYRHITNDSTVEEPRLSLSSQFNNLLSLNALGSVCFHVLSQTVWTISMLHKTVANERGTMTLVLFCTSGKESICFSFTSWERVSNKVNFVQTLYLILFRNLKSICYSISYLNVVFPKCLYSDFRCVQVD